MYYFTKDWYLRCQSYPQTAALRETLAMPVVAYHANADRLAVPSDLREKFLFHDGTISGITVGEADCTVTLDSPYSAYHKIQFCNAVIKQPLPPIGATWLYEELYRHKSGVGYEVHILSFLMQKPKHRELLATDLFETKLICGDIRLV